MKAHPLSRTPDGWFAVALAHEIAPGEVRAIECCGRDLVLYRTATGAYALADAYCPHLGAHLGCGGVVDGEALRCPFHQWEFGADGACTRIPYAKKIPAKARLKAHPVMVRNGAVLAWFHHDGASPDWEIPELVGPEWSPVRWAHLKLKMHIQDIAENGVDIAHFPVIHGSGRAAMRVDDPRGVPFRFELLTSYPGDGIGVHGRKVRVSTQWSYYGLGVFDSISVAEDFGTRVRQIFHFTPVPGDFVQYRIAIFADTATVPPEMLELVLRRNEEIAIANLLEDAPIWERKTWSPRPVLCEGDGAFGLLRRWSRRFYPAPDGERSIAPAPSIARSADGVQEVVPGDLQADRDFSALVAIDSAATRADETSTSASAAAAPSSVREVFLDFLPAIFDPRAAEGKAFAVQYSITGDGPWFVDVRDGRVATGPGAHPAPDVRIEVEARDWIELHTGRLDGAAAFMSGRLKVEGELTIAIELGRIFPVPPRGAPVAA